MATTLETAAAQYAEARTALDEALTGQREARERLTIADNAVTSCQDAERRARRALESAAYPTYPIAG